MKIKQNYIHILEKGNVVFFKPKPKLPYVLWDWAIRLISKNYTHVGLMISKHTMIEANLSGVIIRNLCDCEVDLIKKLREDVNIDEVVNYCLEQEGESYSVPLAILAGVLKMLKLKRTSMITDNWWFCSKMVAAGLKFRSGIQEFYEMIDPETTTPDSLLELEFIWSNK